MELHLRYDIGVIHLARANEDGGGYLVQRGKRI